MAELKFMGATGTVTGSRYLLIHNGHRILVDCGLFQGLKELRQRNWEPFPEDPASIDTVILTHAHIDHTGFLPRLVNQGFKGDVFATTATVDLCQVVLPDSAHLQEEDARYANYKHFSKHAPALPLYTVEDAKATLSLLRPVPYGQTIEIASGTTLTFRDAGHILGSAFADVRVTTGDGERRFLFSGDLGRPGQPILRDPHTVYGTDYLVLESTYGDRRHGLINPKYELARVINESLQRGGVLIIPSFAIGRTQELIFTIRELESEQAIPELPVFIDSPMAITATRIFKKNMRDHDLESKVATLSGIDILQTANLHFAQQQNESVAINKVASRAIIISASGMVTGGRILHHLFNRLPNPNNTVLFIGFQAEGTRGRRILTGEPIIKIHGQMVPVRAKIESLSGFSAHADYLETLAWLSSFNRPPRKVFIVHGEPTQSEALARRIREQFDWPVEIPLYLQTYSLD